MKLARYQSVSWSTKFSALVAVRLACVLGLVHAAGLLAVPASAQPPPGVVSERGGTVRLEVGRAVVPASGAMGNEQASVGLPLERPEHPSERFYNAGVQAHRSARYSEAAALYRRAIEARPDHARAHNNLGFVYYVTNRLEPALDRLQEAVRLRPNFLLARMNLGNTLYRLERFDAAAVQYVAAIRLDPRYVHAHFNLGNAHYKQKRYNRAVRCYRRAVALAPRRAAIHLNLGLALRRSGSVGAAEASFRQAIQLRQGYATAHYELARTLEERGRHAEALRHDRLACSYGDGRSCGRIAAR